MSWQPAPALLAAGLAALAPTQPAQARNADWQPAAIAADHASWLLLDRASVRRKGKKVSVRLLLEYSGPQAGMPETRGEPYQMVRSLMSFDCSARTLLLLEEEYLDDEESLLGQANVTDATWDPVQPESLVEPAYDMLCAKR